MKPNITSVKPIKLVGDFFLGISPFFQPHLRQFLIALTALISSHAIDALIPLFVKQGIDSIAEGHAAASIALLILTLTAARFILLNFGRRRNALISSNLACTLREEIYSHLQTLGIEFYSRHSVGDLMTRASSDVSIIQRFFRFSVHQLLNFVFVFFIALMLMAKISIGLTALLMPILFIMLLVNGFISQRIHRSSLETQNNYAALSEAVHQNIKGIRTIQAHNQENSEISQITKVFNRYAKSSLGLTRLNSLLAAGMILGGAAMTLAVIAEGSRDVMSGHMTVGTLIAFFLYLSMILAAIRGSSQPIAMLISASVAAHRIFGIFLETPKISKTGMGQLTQPILGDISVDNLSFSYSASNSSASAPALKNISLTVRQGETIAIIGQTGAGKSTLLRLLARQLDPSSGKILIDGYDLRQFSIDHIRKNMSFVLQNNFMFATSIQENISFDDPNRPQDLIWAAAREVDLETTLNRFKEKLSTHVGERGATLSGGQRQRIGLARNLIRKAPILLFDDCLSAVDAKTEATILSRLLERGTRSTTILVSSRLSTIRGADRIYVLDKGLLKEFGNHDELMAMDGYYARLVANGQPQSIN